MTENDITLRDIRPEDLDALAALLQQLWPSREISAASIEDAFLKSFELDGHIIRCACLDDRVVGICSMYIRNNLKAAGLLANIDELVVDEHMRNQKIGKLLLLDAEQIALARGCQVLGLESSFHRTDAHRFYEEMGYRKEGYYILRNLEFA